jgi:hypothetical protein
MASIKLKHTSGNGTILNSPAANPNADITLKLPSTTGSAGQVLSVASANHSTTNAELEFAAAGGKVLQVVQTVKKDTFSATLSDGGTNLTGDVTGLTVSITPSNASNKILLMPSISISASTGGNLMVIYKDGSVLTNAIGDAANNTAGNALERMTFGGSMNTYGSHVMTGNFLDTAGGTSSITYSMRLANTRHGYGADITMFVNLGSDSGEDVHSSMARTISTFTAMEIAA